MIKSLYKPFQHWTEKGTIFIVSDTHFEDSDCCLMNENWIVPQEHIDRIKAQCHKNDTLIHLGDVGNPEWLKQLKCYKVLIKGNHDRGSSFYEPYFDEIYEGPLMIAPTLILSHEPVEVPWAFNIHGHCHNSQIQSNELHWNCASDVIGWEPTKLLDLIKYGILNKAPSIHRITIDKASEQRKFHTAIIEEIIDNIINGG